MKTPWKTLFIAGSLAAFGLGAMAQMGHPIDGHEDMSAMHRGQSVSPERMQARVTKHLDELKRKLRISATQETAWASFAAAMKPPSTLPMAMPDRAQLDKLTTPERIDKMRELRTQHQAAMQPWMDQRDEAIKTLYATLDTTQKKTFDTEHAHMMRHGPWHH